MPNPPVSLNIFGGNTAVFAQETPNPDGTFGNVFRGTEVITATIWPEGQEAAVLTQVGSPNAWISGPQSIWVVSLNDTQTATLAPGRYQMLVTAAVAVNYTATLFSGLVEVFATPGSATSTNLASAYYVGKALTEIGLTPGQWDYLPDNIAAASSLFRIYCRRQFTQANYVEIVPVIKGWIRLREIPINWVNRIQDRPMRALSITNAGAAAAWVSVQATGDQYVGLTTTGIVLNAESGGIFTSTPVVFSANETISSLATAVNAVPGWAASADPVLGALSVAELFDLGSAKGAGVNDQPWGAANYHVFSSNVTNSRPYADDGARTGMWWVGEQYGGIGPRWGPGWEEFEDVGQGPGMGVVKVSYNGGFASVPLVIQQATAELVKANYERLYTEAYLKSEAGGQHRYELATELISNLPPAVRQLIEQYRVPNA